MIQKDVELAFGMIPLVICFPYVLLTRKKTLFPGEVIKGDSIFHTNVTPQSISTRKEKKCLNKRRIKKIPVLLYEHQY